jgi:hypothetical protein
VSLIESYRARAHDIDARVLSYDCPPSRASLNEHKDGLGVLIHAVYDLAARLEAAESNLEIARARIDELEALSQLPTPLGLFLVEEN